MEKIYGFRLLLLEVEKPSAIRRQVALCEAVYDGTAAVEAAVVGLEFSDAYYDELQKLYTHKKDLFLNGLKELNIPHTEPQGAYYVMVDISEFGYDSDLDFCVDLIKNVGVAAVPGSSFFKEKENRYIRFHFAKKDETLLAALNRLKDMRAKMPYKKTVG